jgi:hypothetical protein
VKREHERAPTRIKGTKGKLWAHARTRIDMYSKH